MDPNDYYPNRNDSDNSASNHNDNYNSDYNRNYDNHYNSTCNDNYNNDYNNYSNNRNYNYTDPNSQNNGYHPSAANGVSVASLVLGIASIVSLCCGGFGIPIGALGIIFALLSRRGRHMNTQAKVGMGLSIGSLALTAIFLIVCVVFAFSSGIMSDMLNIMKNYDISTESGLEEFMEEWEDYLYKGDYYNNSQYEDDYYDDYLYDNGPYNDYFRGDDHYEDYFYGDDPYDDYLHEYIHETPSDNYI